MKTAMHVLTFGITAAAVIANARFVDHAGNPCAAGEKSLGVSHAQGAAAIGDNCPLAKGIVVVESGAAVTVGADVESDATGRAIPLDSGVSNGTALDAASGAGEFIRVMNI